MGRHKQEDAPKSDIAKRLYAVLDNKKFSAVENEVGLGRGTITKIMRDRDPQFSTITRICRHLGISLDWIATGIGRPYLGFYPQNESKHVLLLPLGNALIDCKQGDVVRLEITSKAEVNNIQFFSGRVREELADRDTKRDTIP